MEVRNEPTVLQHCVPIHESCIFITSSKRGEENPAYNLRMTVITPSTDEETFHSPARSATIYLDALQIDQLILDLQAHLPRMWRKT